VRRALWMALVPALCAFEPLRRPNPLVEEGNGEYRQKRYDQAKERYERARRKTTGTESDADVRYDLGTALLALGRTDEAAAELRQAARGGAGAKAFYNLGNAHLQAQRFADAIDAYRQALRLAPEHQDAKWNLELAMRMKQEEEKKRQQKQQQDQQKQQDPQVPQQQGPQKQDQEKQREQPQDGQERNQPKKDERTANDRAPSEARPDPGATADEAVLDAIERNEKNLQVERLRTLYRRRRVEKDW
jgi:Ca-activated chloride channel homolog